MSSKNIHLINEVPHYYEIDDMIDFCKKYDHLYICGNDKNQGYLYNYLEYCDIKIDGYTSKNPDNNNITDNGHIPIADVEDVIIQPSTGIILAIPDKQYRDYIPYFHSTGFNNYFVMTEYNKRTIKNQQKPKSIKQMSFEINLVDHCNLSCQMCDHYSQLSDKFFVSLEVFEQDIKQMAIIFNHDIACISLLGGEPTLHPNLIKCIEITRREFPNAEIIILTNGLLLLGLEHTSCGGNLWQTCYNLNIHITVTILPIKFDYESLIKKAEEYNVQLTLSSNIHAVKPTKIVKVSDKHPFDLTKSVGKEYYISCIYFNKFHVLREGRFYMCPIAAHIGILNKAFLLNMDLTEKDSLDIYNVKDWHELALFSALPIPFCRYCDLKKWHPHSEWKTSTMKLDEYI